MRGGFLVKVRDALVAVVAQAKGKRCQESYYRDKAERAEFAVFLH